MGRSKKSAEIKIRVTQAIKLAVVNLATKRGEGESVIVREALKAYLAIHNPADDIQTEKEADKEAEPDGPTLTRVVDAEIQRAKGQLEDMRSKTERKSHT